METSTLPQINPGKIKTATKLLKLLNKPKTKMIIDLLAEKGKACMTEVMIRLRCEQSVASQWLSYMESADLLTSERKGKNIYYSINMDRIERINTAVRNFFNG